MLSYNKVLHFFNFLILIFIKKLITFASIKNIVMIQKAQYARNAAQPR